MEKFKLFRAQFQDATTDQIDLLLWKQVYPHEYMDLRERFLETSLPPTRHSTSKSAARQSEMQEHPRLSSHLPAMYVQTHFNIQPSSSIIYIHIAVSSPSSTKTTSPPVRTISLHPLSHADLPDFTLVFIQSDNLFSPS